MRQWGDKVSARSLAKSLGLPILEGTQLITDVDDAVLDLVVELDGSISAEHGIGRMKADLLPHAKGALALELMHNIKQSFDPNGILNPGKIFPE